MKNVIYYLIIFMLITNIVSCQRMNDALIVENNENMCNDVEQIEKLFVDGEEYVVQLSENTPLQIQVVSNEVFYKIWETAYLLNLNLSSVVPMSLKDVNQLCKIKELREVVVNKNKYYYCVLKTKNSDYLYAFFDLENEANQLRYAVFNDKKLKFENFASIKQGCSTKKEVENLYFNNRHLLSLVLEEKEESRSIANDISLPKKNKFEVEEGYVIIRYSKNDVVKNIVFKNVNTIQKQSVKINKIISSICKSDCYDPCSKPSWSNDNERSLSK